MFRATIARFPTTRLGNISTISTISRISTILFTGKISRAATLGDTREQCDGVTTADLSHGSRKVELFFNRSWLCFDQVSTQIST